MFFEIENTPEHIRRSRRTEALVKEQSPQEECPRLELAPFCRAPKVIFDNVGIGTTCEKTLEINNPSKKAQHITLGRDLPPGLEICLPRKWLTLEPETCYDLTMLWTPMQPTALRETVRFIDDARGRYDVVVVLKSLVKGKPKIVKRKSPGKIMKKNVKNSPAMILKNKEKMIFTEKQFSKYGLQKTTKMKYSCGKTSDKENYSLRDNDTFDYQPENSLFNTLSNSFKISEVFPNSKNRRPDDCLRLTYDKMENFSIPDKICSIPKVLKPSNKEHSGDTTSDIFDKLTFTPLKNTVTKTDKLEKGPKIILSVDSLDNSKENLEIIKNNNDDGTHSIVCITPFQDNNKWLNIGDTKVNTKYEDYPTVQTFKVPNTSSPKELFSPNFTINTDISFIPQRFSTEKKISKASIGYYHETHDEPALNSKVSSDTYTKSYSPNNPHLLTEQNLEKHIYMEFGQSSGIYNMKNCRQSLFKESYPLTHSEFQFHNHPTSSNYQNVWSSHRSPPPRSITPPLQSIPEESNNFSDTRVLDTTDVKMNTFTMNRTFNKTINKHTSGIQTWSKKSVRCEPELWKVPIACVRKPKKPVQARGNNERCSDAFRPSDLFKHSGMHNTSNTLNFTSNVYSQSFTIDPFSSSTYFYDEKSVEEFEKEFKKWLNYILTPPTDLDSNVEHKVDVGKAWLENRNKEIPIAPTKEKVSSMYHNSHRLESLRKSARTLLKSPEIRQVLVKLYMHIDKKLIAIRNDKNLHLDVGLQKMIMEILLCYNPLWLRIGLEVIYDIVLPLKSNSDVEGLTIFIVQNMFKNPKIRSKQSRSNMPNMLTPAYLEALKKFTLKKMLTLVFFLDQSKVKKLIPHDPCLFCRNAICKESREILINFTKELIAGIGDITRHLRPLGYVVSHKQSYIDEYKFAVHNLAVDIRDGVRLTKVMEIILLKNNLMCQLRAPPISRLQKVHNVQVALSALKSTDFCIAGEITAGDIADGHREKTLSLLWQIIHVFRAPLFEKAANVIQTWWRKKYAVIVAEKCRQQLIEAQRSSAATVIQRRWRKILYKRKMQLLILKWTNAATVVQKYWRMWIDKKNFRGLKWAVSVIEIWYIGIKKIREAKTILQNLSEERDKLKMKSAVIIQSVFRRWICMKSYLDIKKKVICLQSHIRKHLQRKKFLKLKQTVIFIQQKYKGKIIMKTEMQKLTKIRSSAIIIQSYFRMMVQHKYYQKLKAVVRKIESIYIANIQMKMIRADYLQTRKNIILLQSYFRAKKAKTEYKRQKKCIILLQKKVRATLLMIKNRNDYRNMKNAVIILQKHFKAHLEMRKIRRSYLKLRDSTITIQKHFRSRLIMKAEKENFSKILKSIKTLQQWYRSLLLMRTERQHYLKLKQSASTIQSRYRAIKIARQTRQEYLTFYKVILLMQRKFRALLSMRTVRTKFIQQKTATIVIQRFFKAYIFGKKQRVEFLRQKNAAVIIQRWYRGRRQTKVIKQNYQKIRQSALTIQKSYRTYLIRTEYIRFRKAIITIQKHYRTYREMKIIRSSFLETRNSCITLQRAFRSYTQMKTQRQNYIKTKNAIILIQRYFRNYKQTKMIHNIYCELKKATLTIQTCYRSLLTMRKERAQFLELKRAIIILQRHYNALIIMRRHRMQYNLMRHATITIQRQFRAQIAMKNDREKYLKLKSACIKIQTTYRAHLLGKALRNEYVLQKKSAILIQCWYRQWKQTKTQKSHYLQIKKSVVRIQKWYKYILLRRELQRNRAAIIIQTWYKSVVIRNKCRQYFLKVRKSIVLIQSLYRMHINRRKFVELKKATVLIQNAYIRYRLMKVNRLNYFKCRSSIIKLQSYVRCYLERKRYLKIKTAIVKIQAVYRLKKYRELTKLEEDKKRTFAVIFLQKNIRRYIAMSKYRNYRDKIVYLQRTWRNVLIGKKIRSAYLQKRKLIIQLQSYIRGYLIRKYIEYKKKEIIQLKENQRIFKAASKIQAVFRGHFVRVKVANDKQIKELRRRWREGALQSDQETLREKNEEALDILKNMYDIETVIRAFKSLELLTEVYPMMYDHNADAVVSKIFTYMLTTNRSISSVEILVSAALILVNLTRYSNTALQIYERERISIVLKFMWRFSNSETHLFCILCTYLWLFSKYDVIREDLIQFLHTPENRKILLRTKSQIERMKRMTCSAVKNRPFSHLTKQSHSQGLNQSLKIGNLNLSSHLPALEPDYGILRLNKPRYFENAQQAVNCLFGTYNL